MDFARLDLLPSGLAAGDSLGSTSEFVHPAKIAELYARHQDDGWPFRQVGGGMFRWDAGQATDNTDMTMCIVCSALADGEFDGADVDECGNAKGPPYSISFTTRMSGPALPG